MKFNVGFLFNQGRFFNVNTNNKNICFITGKYLITDKIDCFIYDISLRDNENISNIIDYVIKNNLNATIIPLYLKSNNKWNDSLEKTNNESNYIEDKFNKFVLPLYINNDNQARMIDSLIRNELYLNHIKKDMYTKNYSFKVLLNNYFAIVKLFINTIELKEKYTFEHSRRVAIYSRIIGEQLGFTEDELSKLTLSAYLHDIGKIAINPDVLSKDSKLTNEEFQHIKTHASLGGYLISKYFNDELPSEIINGVIFHHEKFNGRGYPANLIGKSIPLYARLICVADSFDAMTTKRSYNKKKTIKEAIDDLYSQKGKQFDPEIAQCFIDFLSKAENELKDNYRIVFDKDGFIDINYDYYDFNKITEDYINSRKHKKRM